MANDKSSTIKIVIAVVCLAGAAAGLYFAFFATGGGPVLPENGNQPASPEDQGAGDLTEEQMEQFTGGA